MVKMRIITIVVLFIFFESSTAQPNITFRSIDTDDGLSDNYAEQVIEDHRGFMWIGTHGGLNRFDGKYFRYIPLPGASKVKTSDISHDFITALAEDEDNNIWVGTISGLCIYNPQADTFSSINFKSRDKLSMVNNIIEDIVFDKAGNAWIATQKGLHKYDRKTKMLTTFMHDASDISTISGNFIYSLCFDSEGVLWVGTFEGGLDKLAPSGTSFLHMNKEPNGIKTPNVRGIFEDKEGNLWVVASQAGLYVKRRGSEQFVRVPLVDKLTGKEFLSVFSSIAEDNDGNLWIGSYMDGIAVYNKSHKSTTVFTENTRLPSNLSCNSIDRIARDSHGNMWLASHGGGVCIYNPIRSSIWEEHKTPYVKSLPGKIVSCFVEDYNGNIWVGTDGNGISMFDARGNGFEVYSKKDGLTSNAVLGMCMISANQIAVATWNGGLNIFDIKSKRFSNYLYPCSRANGKAQEIHGFYLDKKTNLLWCCTFIDGMQIFDCTGKRFLSRDEVKKIYRYCDTYTYLAKIIPAGNGNTWVLDNYFLSRVNEKAATDYVQADSTKKCISCAFSSDILLGKDGKTWAASFMGLFLYDSVSDCFKEFPIPGMNLSEAKALLEDSHGNIWIATTRALFRYSPGTRMMKNISLSWGMSDMQFYNRSAYRSSDGHLFFGGLTGFIALHEDSTYAFNIKSPLYITNLLIHNVEQHASTPESPLSTDVSFMKGVRLEYDQSYFTLEYAALSYIDNAKIHFKYKLEGFDKDWVYAGNEHKASYTNVPPGTYKFILLSTNSEGSWEAPGLEFAVTILPPWWKTVWFMIALGAVIILSIIAIIMLRERNIMRYNKKLQQRIDQKTRELQQNNDTLLEQKTTIEQNYESLHEKQMVIEIKNTQLQEALYSKDKLLTVIAHDFKNPLSTLHGTALMLKDKIHSRSLADLKPNINSIVSSSESLLSQMIEVLDWSVSDEDNVMCKREDVNLEVLILDVCSLVNETTYQKGISLKVDIKLSRNAMVDPRMISTVLRNLVINSIKFTSKGGEISITAREENEQICIEVSDNGIGMSQEQIEAILTDKNLLSSDYRSGFGLQICKSFIRRNSGAFSIRSKVDRGSSFFISLPQGKALEAASVRKEEFHAGEPEFKYNDNKKTMLVIDDDVETISFMKEIFSRDFIIQEAYNGSEGIRVAQDIIPEIILSDINLPIIDGKQLCHILKANNITNHIPIILISAESLPQHLVDSLMHGADDYLVKPFNISVLQQKVNSILKNRELLLQHFRQTTFSVEEFSLPESVDDKIIKDIARIVVENLSDADFTVETLADEVKMSRSQLYRKTKAVLGISPIEYINNIKLQKALEMIKTGKYRVSEVAYEVGFSDPRYFSQCFTKKFGVNPSTYYNRD